ARQASIRSRISPTRGAIIDADAGRVSASASAAPASSRRAPTRVPTASTGPPPPGPFPGGGFSRQRAAICSLNAPQSPWSEPKTITPGRTAGESEISGSASGRSRRSACIPRFTPRAYSAREATASSYCRMLTVASAFIVRTMERRSWVVSSRLRIASVVCIGFGSEGFLDAATGQREDPPALLVGERLPPFDAGPYLGKLAADRLPDDAF